MRLENNEYIVSKAGVPDESITITKAALEKWRDHYLRLMKKLIGMGHYGQALACMGKADSLTDLLKHFEEEGA